ncbi:hypothetical protein L873DRAFT_1810496, partial [Choiromyces venosus 120613-1]
SNLPPLPSNCFYARIKKKTGPKQKSLSEVLCKRKEPTNNLHRTYTVNYKLRILSYWKTSSIPYSPSNFHAPTWAEVAARFRLLATNLSRWKKEEEAGHYI